MLAKAYAKKNQKKTKKNQKNPKKTSFQFQILAKTNAKKNQKKPKKTKKNQCQFGNLKKPKKTKKNQKKPMPIYRFWCSDWFFFGFFWVSTPPKKTKKKPKKNQCQFADFGVATGFFWVSTPPPQPSYSCIHLTYIVQQLYNTLLGSTQKYSLTKDLNYGNYKLLHQHKTYILDDLVPLITGEGRTCHCWLY